MWVTLHVVQSGTETQCGMHRQIGKEEKKKKKDNTESCVAAGLKPFRLKGRHDFELNWRGSVRSELEEKQDAILKKELDWVILLQVQILPGHRRHSEHIRALASVHSVLLAPSLHYLTHGNPLINPGSTYFSGKWCRLRIHHTGLAFANTAPTGHSNSSTTANEPLMKLLYINHLVLTIDDDFFSVTDMTTSRGFGCF